MLAVGMLSSRMRTSEPTKLGLGWDVRPSGMGEEETGREEKCFLASETSSLCSTPPVPTRTIRSAV